MNENLKTVLRAMLFMSDEQPTTDVIDKINFKKDGWYKKFHWTEKQEEKFIKYLLDYLKTNWKGITDKKPINKSGRDKAAQEFVLNYSPCYRKLKINDFVDTVSYEQLKEVMSKKEYEDFINWIYGSTVPVGGVYRCDLKRYLER